MIVVCKRIVKSPARAVMISEADMNSGKVFMVFFMAVPSVKASAGKRVFRKKKKDYRYDKAKSENGQNRHTQKVVLLK